jgi:hypothetical protein
MSGYALWAAWAVMAVVVVVGGIAVRKRLNRVERGADEPHGPGREHAKKKHGSRPE